MEKQKKMNDFNDSLSDALLQEENGHWPKNDPNDFSLRWNFSSQFVVFVHYIFSDNRVHLMF